MPTQLQEIQKAAIDASSPIAPLLRRCAVLAARLKNEDLRAWVNAELNGYPADASLPDYRIVPAPALGHLAGPFNSGYRNITIPPAALPEHLRHFAEQVHLRQPIAELETLSRVDDSKGELSCPWPGNLIVLMQQESKFAPGFTLYAAWQSLSRARVVGLIDSVRNRVLEFALRLEQEAPAAGEPDQPESQVPAGRVTQLYQTIIHGNVVSSNIATGDRAMQSLTVNKGDFASLRDVLIEWGIPNEDVAELETALKQDPPAESLEKKPKTSAWIARTLQKTLAGTYKLASGVTIELVARAIGAYLGI